MSVGGIAESARVRPLGLLRDCPRPRSYTVCIENLRCMDPGDLAVGGLAGSLLAARQARSALLMEVLVLRTMASRGYGRTSQMVVNSARRR